MVIVFGLLMIFNLFQLTDKVDVEKQELNYLAMPEARIPNGRMTRQQIEDEHDAEMLRIAKELEWR